MSSQWKFSIVAACLAVLSPLVDSAGNARAQSATSAGDPITYRYYDQTFYRDQPVEAFKWVEQEVTETKQKKRWVQQYDTQTLEKTSVSYRPVEKTSERIEKYKELEPVTVTKFREKRIEETNFETEVEMRDQTVVVKKPVVETVMREKQFKVREKVTEPSFEYKPVTTYKPVQVPQTTLVPAGVVVPGVVGNRPRVQWLRPGNYVDPLTGLSVFRRRGLHWVNPTPVAAVVPALVPQAATTTAMIPETVLEKEPIEISRFIDRVETRKVPVEVQRLEETYETRKVPVEVRRPKTTVRVEKIPYQETTYQEIEKVRKIPVVERTMQKVETIEPYQQTTVKWVEKVEAVPTSKIVRKKVPYMTTKKVPYTVRMRVAVDCFGNSVGKPQPVDPRWNEFLSTTNRPSDEALATDVTLDRNRAPASLNVDPLKDRGGNGDGGLRSPTAADLPPVLGATTSAKPAVSSVSDGEIHSVLVPETETEIETSTSLSTLATPPLEVKTPLRSLAVERSPEQSVGTADTVETAVDPITTGSPSTGATSAQPSAAQETSVRKPAIDAGPQTNFGSGFNKDLIAPADVPNIAPRTFDVEGLDQVEKIRRRSITNIY